MSTLVMCLGVCVCVFLLTQSSRAPLHACRSQRRTLEVQLCHSPTYVLETGSFTEIQVYYFSTRWLAKKFQGSSCLHTLLPRPTRAGDPDTHEMCTQFKRVLGDQAEGHMIAWQILLSTDPKTYMYLKKNNDEKEKL